MRKYYKLQFYQQHLSLLSEWNFWICPTLQDWHEKQLETRHTWDKKTIFYIGLSIWNSLPDSFKKANGLNNFKHNVKKQYLTWIKNNELCENVCLYLCLYVRTCVYTYIWVCISVFSFNLSILMFFPRLHFHLFFVLTWRNTMKIRCFCPFCAVSAITDAIHIYLQ